MARFLCALVAVVMFAASCDFGIGPANSYQDAPRYLRRHGYDEDVIKKFMTMDDLGEKTFAKLASEDSTDVRFLVAQNPHLPQPIYEKLLKDNSDFVRGGAALNPKISEEQARTVSKSGTHTTKAYLAQNPHISERILINLHEKHGMELVWFAMNPKPPESLVGKMRATRDEQALYLLKVTKGREDYKRRQREDTLSKDK